MWRIDRDGTLTTTVAHAYDVSWVEGDPAPAYTTARGDALVPLSGGGVAASHHFELYGDHAAVDPVVRAYGDASPSTMSVPGLWTLGAAGDGGTVHAVTEDFVTETTTSRVLDMTTGVETASHVDFHVTGALADGHVVGRRITTGQVETRAATGQVLDSVAPPGAGEWSHVAGQLWVGPTEQWDGVAAYVGPELVPAPTSPFPWRDDPWEEGAITRSARVVNFRDEPIVFKHERCSLGFGEVAAAPSPGRARYYFGPVDGVKPTYAQWNAEDWFKIPNGAGVIIPETTTSAPGAFGVSTWDLGAPPFCRQDDPAHPNYPLCWGRRVEPQWSADTGQFLQVGWRYPHTLSVQERCGEPPPWWQFWKSY